VVATDNVSPIGNSSEAKIVTAYTVAEALGIESCEGQPTTKDGNDNPVYTNRLSFQPDQTYLDSKTCGTVSGYQLYRYRPNDATGSIIETFSPPLDGNKFCFDDVMSGVEYAHEKMSYKLNTVYTNGTNELGGDIIDSAEVCNYVGYDIQMVKSEVLIVSTESDTDWSDVQVVTNKLSDYKVKLTSTTDIEGDTIQAFLEETGGAETEYSDSLGLDILVSENTQKMFTVKAVESQTGADWKVNSQYGTFTVIYDTIAPQYTSTPVLGTEDESTTYDGENHTPKQDVWILGLQAQEGGSAGLSGISALNIWNEGNEGEAKTYTWDGSINNIDWNLEEGDGTKIVSVQVVDRAGNATKTSLSTILDTTGPVASGTAFGTVSYENGKILIRWNEALDSFSDTYTDAGLLTYRISVDGTEIGTELEREYSFAPDSSTGNRKIPMKLWAIDSVGNPSSVQEYENLYTPASIGSIAAIEAEAEPDHTYRLTFTNTGSANATSEFLRVWQEQGGSYSDVDPEDGSERFLVTDVSPRGTRWYQLFAVNACGFETETEVGSYTVANAIPAIPSALLPDGLSTANPTFSWQGELSDADGDQITYKLSYRLAEDGQWTDIEGIANLYYDADESILQILADGTEIEWKVLAADDWGGEAESAETAFTVDDVAPEAVVEKVGDGDLFTNAPTMKVALKDSNGIQYVLYTSTDGYASGLEAVVVDDGAGGFTATVPLHESLRDGTGNGMAYRISCAVYDRAGNPTNVESTDLRVDWTAPLLPDVTQNASLVNGIMASASGRFTASATGSDDFAGLKEIEYGFVKERDGTPSFVRSAVLKPVASPDGDRTSGTYTVPVTMTGTDGASYYLTARAVDHAGNTSQTFVASTAVLLDTTAPMVSIGIAGLTAHGSRFYLASAASLTVESDCVDADTMASQEFAMAAQGDGAATLTWRDSIEAAKADLAAGGSYAVGIRGTNSAGGSATAYSTVFTYDPNAPTGLSMDGENMEGLVKGEQVRFRVGAEDGESGIRIIAVSIGSIAGGTDLSAQVLGNIDGLLVRDAADGWADFRFPLPDAADGVYYLSIRATNGAGLTATESLSDPMVTVSSSTAKLVVTDQGPYSSVSDRLRASWFYNGSAAVSGFRFRVMGPDAAVLDWTDTTESCATVEGLSLEHGKTYRFEVQAAFTDGTVSATASSDGVTVDLTPAVFAAQDGFTVPSASTSNGLRIGWNVTDAESGISSLQVIIETYGADGNTTRIADPIPLNVAEGETEFLLSADADGSPLDLESGTKALVTLRATNGGGATVDITGPAVMIDDSEPPVPVVTDQGDVINTMQYLEANWIWTASDPESGTSGFEWALVSSPTAVAVATWHDVEDGRTIDLSVVSDLDDASVRADKAVWYFAVRARNAAGLQSIGLSDGIVYDATAPFVAKVRLLNAGSDPLTASELNYVTSLENLAVYIDSYEDLTQDMNYQVDSGTQSGGAWAPSATSTTVVSNVPLIALSEVTVAAGETTSFRGLVLNEAGLVSEYGYTQGVILSADSPEVTAVHGRMLGYDLYFDWDATEGVTPIRCYYAALVPVAQTNGTPSESQWAALGLSRTVSFNKETDGIEDGQYVLFVKAKNAAGLESSAVKSATVTFDDSAAEVSGVATPRFASTKVALVVNAEDGESGISEYLYAVGTFEEPTIFSSGWVSAAYRGTRYAIDVAFSGFPSTVPDGAMLRVSVRVRNGAGLWSADEIGGAIYIDQTPAATPTVTANAYTVYKTRVEGIGYASTDAQSGITLIKIAAVDSVGAAMPSEAEAVVVGSDTNFTAETAVTDFILYGLNLQEAGSYHIAVQAKNGAGDWSAVGYSTAVIVDTIAPTIVFEDGTGTKTVNEGPTTVGFTLSEAAGVNVGFLEPGGTSAQGPIFDAAKGSGTIEFHYTAEGTYVVSAVLTDLAGNIGNVEEDAKSLALRINAAPKVYLGVHETTPGRPRVLSANVIDTDGDTPLTYLWTFGDGNGTSGEETPTHTYIHTEVRNQTTEYTVTLTVTDALGKSTTQNSKVMVENTYSGILYVDEYWSGNREIRGDLTIPAGITLTVEAGTQIMATGPYGLNVEGILTTQTGTMFGLKITATSAWKGIGVSGTATLTGTEIREAQRGLTTLSGSTVTVTDCTFLENTTGVHAYGSSPRLSGSSFQDSKRYGVKEDAGGRPQLDSCKFGGNLYDYYSEMDAVIEMEKLNAINGNSGNTEE